jgi:hypothetical protein
MVEELKLISERLSKFRLGKITNKFLIIELYAFAYVSIEESAYRMFKHDKSTRQLLIEEYKKAFKNNNHWRLPLVSIKWTKNVDQLEEPLEFTITSQNHLNNNFRLFIHIYSMTNLQSVLEILQ